MPKPGVRSLRSQGRGLAILTTRSCLMATCIWVADNRPYFKRPTCPTTLCISHRPIRRTRFGPSPSMPKKRRVYNGDKFPGLRADRLDDGGGPFQSSSRWIFEQLFDKLSFHTFAWDFDVTG